MVTVSVFNLRGEKVRQLWNGLQAAGNQGMHWDGRLASGETAPSGVYICAVAVGDEIVRTRVSLIK